MVACERAKPSCCSKFQYFPVSVLYQLIWVLCTSGWKMGLLVKAQGERIVEDGMCLDLFQWTYSWCHKGEGYESLVNLILYGSAMKIWYCACALCRIYLRPLWLWCHIVCLVQWSWPNFMDDVPSWLHLYLMKCSSDGKWAFLFQVIDIFVKWCEVLRSKDWCCHGVKLVGSCDVKKEFDEGT